MSSKYYILIANVTEGLGNILIAVALCLLSSGFIIGLATFLHGIPYTIDKVVSVERQHCTNFSEWDMDLVITEKGYRYYRTTELPSTAVGEIVDISFWDAHLGFFHMGTCTLVER